MSEVVASITFEDLHDVPNLLMIDQWCIGPPPTYKPDICVGVTLPEISSVFRPHRSQSEQQRRREVLGLLSDALSREEDTATPPPRSTESGETTEDVDDAGRAREEEGVQTEAASALVVRREEAQTQTIPTSTTTIDAPIPTTATPSPVAPNVPHHPISYQPQLLCYSPYLYTLTYPYPTTSAAAAATPTTTTTTAAPTFVDAAAPTVQSTADQPATSTVMCCYYKQQGWCKMGERCWYAHEGVEETPCHYGSACEAGHSHLTTAPPLARTRRAAPPAGGSAAPRSGGGAEDALRYRFKIHHPCLKCGAPPAHLLGRRIPVWNETGHGVSMCVRASCGVCGSSYLL